MWMTTTAGSTSNDSKDKKVAVPSSQTFLTQFFTKRHLLVPDTQHPGTFTVHPTKGPVPDPKASSTSENDVTDAFLGCKIL